MKLDGKPVQGFEHDHSEWRSSAYDRSKKVPYKAIEHEGAWAVINEETEEIRADDLAEDEAKQLERTLNKLEGEIDNGG